MTRSFPLYELYGVTSQIRRASVSIAANIAEGYKKRSKSEKLHFLNISQGSFEECRYYLILVRDLGYAKTGPIMDQLEEVSRILEAYMKGIKRNAR